MPWLQATPFSNKRVKASFGAAQSLHVGRGTCLKPPLPNPPIPALSPHLLFFWTLNNQPHGSLAGQTYGEMNIPPHQKPGAHGTTTVPGGINTEQRETESLEKYKSISL